MSVWFCLITHYKPQIVRKILVICGRPHGTGLHSWYGVTHMNVFPINWIPHIWEKNDITLKTTLVFHSNVRSAESITSRKSKLKFVIVIAILSSKSWENFDLQQLKKVIWIKKVVLDISVIIR